MDLGQLRPFGSTTPSHGDSRNERELCRVPIAFGNGRSDALEAVALLVGQELKYRLSAKPFCAHRKSPHCHKRIRDVWSTAPTTVSFVELHLVRSVESVSRRLAPLAVVHMGQKHERFRNSTADRGGQLIQVVRAICAADCEYLGLLASIVAATLHTQG